jgi:hypothetical protein
LERLNILYDISALSRQDKADKTRQDKTGQDKTRKDKKKQDNTTQDTICKTEEVRRDD